MFQHFFTTDQDVRDIFSKCRSGTFASVQNNEDNGESVYFATKRLYELDSGVFTMRTVPRVEETAIFIAKIYAYNAEAPVPPTWKSSITIPIIHIHEIEIDENINGLFPFNYKGQEHEVDDQGRQDHITTVYSRKKIK